MFRLMSIIFIISLRGNNFCPVNFNSYILLCINGRLHDAFLSIRGNLLVDAKYVVNINMLTLIGTVVIDSFHAPYIISTD